MKNISYFILFSIGALTIFYITFAPSDETEIPQIDTTVESNIDAAHTESDSVTSLQTRKTSLNSSLAILEKDDTEIELAEEEIHIDSEVSIGAFLVSSENNNTLHTDQLSSLSARELRNGIINLDYDGSKDNLAFEIEYKLERKLNSIPNVISDTLRCSTTMCGLMFSGTDRASIMNALEQLSRDEEIGSVSGGGFLRHLEEGGVHYGMVALVFSAERSLSIN